MMEQKDIRILVVDHNQAAHGHFGGVLSGEPMCAQIHGVATVAEARATLKADPAFHCAMVGFTLRDGTAISFLEKIRIEDHLDIPVLVYSDSEDNGQAVASLEAGAQDFLVTDELNGTTLCRRISYALNRHAHQERLLKAESRLAELSKIDPLTGIANRRGFEVLLDLELAQAKRTNMPLAAILIDCDNFKGVNDGHGYAVGDEVLKKVAHAIGASIRESDHGARIGGDEFLALLPNTSAQAAGQVAERIRRNVAAATLRWRDQQIDFTVSIGVITLPPGTSSLSDILENCHSCLRESKSQGKNTVSVLGHSAPRQSPLQTQNFPLSVHSLPIFDLQTEQLVGHEFMTRGPAGALESPEDFFHVARERGHLATMDLRCAQTVFAHAASSKGQWVNLNLFPSTLIETPLQTLLGIFSKITQDRHVVVDLSAQWMPADPAPLLPIIASLRECGVRFAFDGLGHGRSSFEYLILLKPEFVKVDGELVQDMAWDRRSTSPLQRVHRVARALGARVIAERIDDRERVPALVAKDIPFAQGKAFLAQIQP